MRRAKGEGRRAKGERRANTARMNSPPSERAYSKQMRGINLKGTGRDGPRIKVTHMDTWRVQ